VAIVAAIVATPFLHSNYARWSAENSKMEVEADDADTAYVLCNVDADSSGKTFDEKLKLCHASWERWRDTKEQYKGHFWLIFLFSGK
jgi:hypothetical protein